jgi:hypothetical protein
MKNAMTGTVGTGRLVAGFACAALFAAPSAIAAVPFKDAGSPNGALTHVVVGNDLSCQVAHTGDTSLEFFPPTVTPGDCGTFLAIGGTLFTPDFSNHDSTSTAALGTRTAFSPVSQSEVAGSGSLSDPFRITTKVTAGSTGLELTEIDTYVAGEESYRTDITIKNTGGSSQSLILYRAGDCYLQNSDAGFGFADASNKSVGCSQNANNNPAGRIEQWVPITPGNNYTEDGYNLVWSKIAAKTSFDDTCVRCGESIDNGAGISWEVMVPAGASVTRAHYTTFSPTGQAGPPPSAGNTSPGGNAPPQEPPVTGPRGNPLGLPPSQGCVDTRKFSFKLHHSRGRHVVEVDIFINHRFVRAVTGRNIKRLTLERLPIGRFKVRLVATQDSGSQLISQRVYRGCKKSRPKSRRRGPRR